MASELAELELELGEGLLLELELDDELLGLGDELLDDELLELDDELPQKPTFADCFVTSEETPGCISHATAITQHAPLRGMSPVTKGIAGVAMGPMRVPLGSSKGVLINSGSGSGSVAAEVEYHLIQRRWGTVPSTRIRNVPAADPASTDTLSAPAASADIAETPDCNFWSINWMISRPNSTDFRLTCFVIQGSLVMEGLRNSTVASAA